MSEHTNEATRPICGKVFRERTAIGHAEHICIDAPGHAGHHMNGQGLWWAPALTDNEPYVLESFCVHGVFMGDANPNRPCPKCVMADMKEQG